MKSKDIKRLLNVAVKCEATQKMTVGQFAKAINKLRKGSVK